MDATQHPCGDPMIAQRLYNFNKSHSAHVDNAVVSTQGEYKEAFHLGCTQIASRQRTERMAWFRYLKNIQSVPHNTALSINYKL